MARGVDARNDPPTNDGLRVTFIAGGLGRGGAEKQFLYMLRTLQDLDASIQVLTLTTGEYHAESLTKLGIHPIPVGIPTNPVSRVLAITRAVRTFRPHFIQATHFFTSFYAGMAGRLARIPSIGAIRSDLHLDIEGVGRSAAWIMRMPSVFLANSYHARQNAQHLGLPVKKILVLQNVIDLREFDAHLSTSPPLLLNPDHTRVITVGRMVPVKRMERFLQALAIAREKGKNLEGVIVGGGPEEERLRAEAARLGLRPDQPKGGVLFLGERSDVAQLLGQSDIYVLTSDREGFPNVLLEAMAAGLPLLSTPAGESSQLVHEGVNGYLVPFDDVETLANRMILLAESASRRKVMGRAGRHLVETQYNYPLLGKNLIQAYRDIAEIVNSRDAQSVLDRVGPVPSGAQKIQAQRGPFTGRS
jgi:glycosyltransferase involved in cell wall biosynthesis